MKLGTSHKKCKHLASFPKWCSKWAPFFRRKHAGKKSWADSPPGNKLCVFHSFGELKLLTLVGVVRKEDVQTWKNARLPRWNHWRADGQSFLLEGVMRVLPLWAAGQILPKNRGVRLSGRKPEKSLILPKKLKQVTYEHSISKCQRHVKGERNQTPFILILSLLKGSIWKGRDFFKAVCQVQQMYQVNWSCLPLFNILVNQTKKTRNHTIEQPSSRYIILAASRLRHNMPRINAFENNRCGSAKDAAALWQRDRKN